MRRTLALIAVALCGCSDDPDPAWCTQRAELTIACPGPYCAAAVVVDYKRLEPRGFRIFALEGQPVDQAAAEAKALDHVQNVLKADKPDRVMTKRATGAAKEPLDFFYSYLSYDLSGDDYLVIIHAPTGQLLFAEREVWADMIAERGHDQPLPAGFEGPEALGCQAGSHTPALQQFVFTGEGTALTKGEDALRVVRRLNLNVRLMGDRPYQAMAITYAPATGEFDVEAADWYVWLSRL